MCKFNNRLFVFSLCGLLGVVNVLAKSIQGNSRDNADNLGALVALSALLNSQDVHYDQRQKGDENYRIKLDSFFIGLPQEDSTALLLLTDNVFEGLDDDNLLAYGKNKPDAKFPASSANSPVALSSTSSESQPKPSLTAATTSNNALPLVVEIPVSKKYLESRQGVDPLPKTKSYITQFLNLLKRGRKFKNYKQ